MTTQHPEQEFIKERAAKLANAYNNRDVEKALGMFADEGLEYSDYGVMALDMDKAALSKFGSMFSTLKTLDIETVSVSGHKNFTAWEWKMHFTKEEVSDFEEFDKKESKEDELLTMLGVSVTWWNDEGKIVKNHDYARFA